MALILGGGAFGELRGKMGSMVFARNKGGAYVRSFAKPVDPRTIAQITARSKFGSASSIYHSLDDSAKANWHAFASSVFNAKTGKIGVSSGFNAFVSLANVVNNVKIFDSYSLENTAPIVGTEIPFITNGIPPALSLQSNIKLTSLGPGSANFIFGSADDLTYTSAMGISTFAGVINFNYTGEVGSGTTSAVLQDDAGNKFGFKVFMSNPVSQKNMFIQNPYLIDLGAMPAQSFTPSADFRQNFKMNFSANLDAGNYQSLPNLGQFVQLTVFQVGQTGMLLKVGAQTVEVI